MPWPLFLMLARGTAAVEARKLLVAIEGVTFGIAGAFNGKPGGPVPRLLKKLQDSAYPER